MKRIVVPLLNHRSPITVSASGTTISSCLDVDVDIGVDFDIPQLEIQQFTDNR
jgi:hypothetical protein